MTKNKSEPRTAAEYKTNREAAAYIRVSEITLWRLRKNGLPFHRIGSKVLFDRRDLDSFMESQKRNGGGNNER